MPNLTVEVPKIIHFIWLGKPIPEEYLINILSFMAAAKKHDYKVQLWLDNVNHYHQTAEKCSFKLNGLILRNIDEVLSTVETENPTTKKLVEYAKREMCGVANYGAASDMIRLFILKQESGLYVDTDLRVRLGDDIDTIFAPRGFLTAYIQGSGEGKGIYNALIAATPKNRIINTTLQAIYDKYQKLEADNSYYYPASAKPKYRFNRMDDKRDLFANEEYTSLTIDSSGPGILEKVLLETAKLPDHIENQFSFPVVKSSYEEVSTPRKTDFGKAHDKNKQSMEWLNVGGAAVMLRSDMSWARLDKTEEQKYFLRNCFTPNPSLCIPAKEPLTIAYRATCKDKYRPPIYFGIRRDLQQELAEQALYGKKKPKSFEV